MSKHRAEAPARGSRLPRAALWSLAGLAVVGLGIQGTLAAWNDTATVPSTTVQSGTLDITGNGGLVGAGGTTSLAALSLAQAYPGESVAATFPVGNAGSAGLTYTVTGTAAGALAPGMRYAVYAGGSATNTGSAAGGDRTGTCTGTLVSTSAAVTLGTGTTTVVSSARTLAVGAGETLCVRAALDAAADSNLQGTSTTASLVLAAKQVGAA